jgi:hypothetical protein
LSIPYDVAIVTRNRPGILSLSLPTVLSQDPPPASCCVVDSSDDPTENQKEVADIAQDFPSVPLTHCISPPGIFLQRKTGASLGSSPILFFPDDDSLLLPGAAKAVLDVYEADKLGVLGAVMMGESPQPPPSVSLESADSITKNPIKRLAYRLGAFRADLEDSLAPNPVRMLGERLTLESLQRLRLDKPGALDWLTQAGGKLDRNLQGFRMTFRRDVFSECRAAGSLTGYSLYEDEITAMEVLQKRLIAEAPEGMTYHHRAAGGRLSAFSAGVHMALNLAFLVFTFCPPGSRERSLLLKSLKVRRFGYAVRSASASARLKAQGLSRAIPLVKDALAVPPEAAAEWRQGAVRLCLDKSD